MAKTKFSYEELFYIECLLENVVEDQVDKEDIVMMNNIINKCYKMRGEMNKQK